MYVDRRNNFIVFAVALVALLLVSAVAHGLPGGLGRLFNQAMTLAVLAVAYVSLRFGPLWRPFVATILLLTVLTTALERQFAWPGAALAYHVIGLLFFTGALANCSRTVLLSSEVGTNLILGALSIYLLLGILWANLYTITLYFLPGAFHGIHPRPGTDHFPRMLYFSYITLATVGYGDIRPVLPLSKTLAYLEAIAGTFYLAIVVASLVSARRSGPGRH